MEITFEISSLILTEQASKALENIKQRRKEKTLQSKIQQAKLINNTFISKLFKKPITENDITNLDHYWDDIGYDEEVICNHILFNSKHNPLTPKYTISVKTHNQILKWIY